MAVSVGASNGGFDAMRGHHRSEYAEMGDDERGHMRDLRDGLDEREFIRAFFQDRLLPSCANCSPRFALAEILEANPS